jgi:phospholipid/cholesterol/gamma-HCH transport system substrate-binding protein
VRYKGVAVGRVTGIELDKTVRGNVLVRIAVNDSVPVTASTFAMLGFQGVTGLAFIALDDSGDSAVALQTSPQAVARIPMRQGLMSRLSDQGGKLLGQLEKASGQMNQLLDTDNQKNLMAAVTNLGQAAASITVLTNRANAMLSGTGPEGSVNLPRVAEQASTTLKSIAQTSEQLKVSADTVRQSAGEFRQMSARMNEPGGTLDRIARSTDALVNTSQTINTNVAPRLNRSAEDASRAARQVGRLVEGLNDNPQMLLTGKGAAVPGPGEAGFVVPTNP